MRINIERKISGMLETVRERELYSSEISFINYAKNIKKINNKNIEKINMGGLYAKDGI